MKWTLYTFPCWFWLQVIHCNNWCHHEQNTFIYSYSNILGSLQVLNVIIQIIRLYGNRLTLVSTHPTQVGHWFPCWLFINFKASCSLIWFPLNFLYIEKSASHMCVMRPHINFIWRWMSEIGFNSTQMRAGTLRGYLKGYLDDISQEN